MAKMQGAERLRHPNSVNWCYILHNTAAGEAMDGEWNLSSGNADQLTVSRRWVSGSGALYENVADIGRRSGAIPNILTGYFLSL